MVSVKKTKEKLIVETLEKIEEEIIVTSSSNNCSIGGNQAIEKLENKYNKIWNNLDIPLVDNKVGVPIPDLSPTK